MILDQNVKLVSFKKKDTQFDFLPSGDVFQFLSKDILINQFLGNTLTGSANNIYLRVYDEENLKVIPLLGNKSSSKFKHNGDIAVWSGEAEGIEYKVTFKLSNESIWFWTVDLQGSNQEVDLLYAQDISVSNKGATITNELYMSQYLDHKVIEGKNGFVISSRQNQSQGERFPYLQQGSVNTKIIGYSTDAMQFFGKEYKLTDEPALLYKDLPNENYQYELSYTALQTEKFNINEKTNVVFYGIFKENYETAITKIEFIDEIEDEFKKINNVKEEFIENEPIEIKEEFSGTLVSERFTKEDIENYFPKRKMEETYNGKLVSFFTEDNRHIVLQEKELEVERPHGHIITTGIDEKKVSSGLITSTNYMFGVFNAQVVVGNTNLNKLMSTTRGLLNILKNSGQRIYVKYKDKFRILTMPAAYELGINHSKWFYKLEDDVLVIKSYAAKEKADIILSVESEKNKSYEFIITNQLVMGSNEFEQSCNMEKKGNKIIISANENTFLHNNCPEIHYNINVLGTNFEVSDDSIFYVDRETRNGTLLTIKTEEVSKFKLVIQGCIDNNRDESLEDYTLEEENKKFYELYNRLTCGFKLSIDKEECNNKIDKINEIFWWYTHNALTHYAVPHGLEQPGGAAWGTRDVCQGPLEYFLMTQKYDLAREIIKEIFRHQFKETGEWPQWFMFDNYNMQQDDSHGDVIFWPLKVIGDYIKITGDDSILEEELEYRHFPYGAITEKETILSHIEDAMISIKGRFLYDSALISYAGGDWDDTLQPANKELREKLVSSWTMALAYQTIKQLAEVLEKRYPKQSKELKEISDNIKDAFNNLLIKDGVIAGFAYCENENNIEYMLHPEDKKTGINYRLLPMTRSIISELVSNEQAEKNIDLIEEHLMCPDGVRLMNHPATYKGGVIEFFQRAEQAANVGREIGLQYVHAHVRFIEAMAKIGRVEKAWKAIFTINPINIREEVKNAVIRQSNTYFSSSDGDFKDRYEFQENFNKLRTGEVDVKGGWRIYSSGPGIYLNQLVSNILGIRFEAEDLILDPVIPTDLDGLNFEYEIYNTKVKFVYNIKGNNRVNEVEINGTKIKGIELNNLYRNAGIKLLESEIKPLLNKEINVIEVSMI